MRCLTEDCAGSDTPCRGTARVVTAPRSGHALWVVGGLCGGRAWLASSPINTVGTAGGYFAEVEAVQEELLETLRAGPGEAARREVAVGASGPAPSRWTLRTIRASVDWLTDYTVSGVWRLLQSWGLGLHTSCARLFSPDPDYRSKVRRLHRCLRDAARHPDTVVALFLDEFGYQRWPEVAPTWGLEAAVAQRAGNNQQWRTIGALNALTGQVNYLDGYIVGRQQVSPVLRAPGPRLSGGRPTLCDPRQLEHSHASGCVDRSGTLSPHHPRVAADLCPLAQSD